MLAKSRATAGTAVTMRELSMATRREITKKYASDYGKSSKNAKGLVLDELVAVTGWSRANARRALSTARKRKVLRG